MRDGDHGTANAFGAEVLSDLCGAYTSRKKSSLVCVEADEFIPCTKMTMKAFEPPS